MAICRLIYDVLHVLEDGNVVTKTDIQRRTRDLPA